MSTSPVTKPFRRRIDHHRARLDTMLNPRTVALIGATEAQNSVGRTIMENLLAFDGTVYPINPKRSTVLGVKAFANIADTPEPVDLVVLGEEADGSWAEGKCQKKEKAKV